MAKGAAKERMIDEIAASVKEKIHQEQVQANDPLGLSGETDPAPDSNASTLAANIESSILFDIFSYCETHFIAVGDGVKYVINKNGSLLAVREHPFSWEQIQKEYGGGRYHVIAQSVSTGKILKHQKKTLAEAPGSQAPTFAFAEPKEASPGGELMALMLQMQERQAERDRLYREEQEIRRREDEHRRREEKEDRFKLVTTLATVLGPLVIPLLKKEGGVDPTVNLMLESIKESNRNSTDQMTRMFDEVRRLFEKKSNPEMDPVNLVIKLQEAEERGFTKGVKMHEMVDEKAEVRAAEMMAGAGEKDETVTSTLIKAFAPAIPALISMGTQAPKQPLAVPQPIQRPQPVQAGQPKPPVRTVVQTTPARVITQPQGLKAPAQPQSVKPQAVAQPMPPKTVTSPPKQPQPSGIVAPEAQGKVINMPSKEEAVTPAKDETLKQALIERLTPYIGMALMKRQTPQDTADALLGELTSQGVSVAKVLENFKLADLIELGKANRLPEAVNPWFNDFYAHFEAASRVADRKPS